MQENTTRPHGPTERGRKPLTNPLVILQLQNVTGCLALWGFYQLGMETKSLTSKDEGIEPRIWDPTFPVPGWGHLGISFRWMDSHHHANKHLPDNQEGSGCRPSILKSTFRVVVWASTVCTSLRRYWDNNSYNAQDFGQIFHESFTVRTMSYLRPPCRDMEWQLVPISLLRLHRKKQGFPGPRSTHLGLPQKEKQSPWKH